MVYLLEDDDSIRKLVVYGLQSQGYEAQGFETPSAFWKAINQQVPNLVLLAVYGRSEEFRGILDRVLNIVKKRRAI